MLRLPTPGSRLLAGHRTLIVCGLPQRLPARGEQRNFGPTEEPVTLFNELAVPSSSWFPDHHSRCFRAAVIERRPGNTALIGDR